MKDGSINIEPKANKKAGTETIINKYILWGI